MSFEEILIARLQSIIAELRAKPENVERKRRIALYEQQICNLQAKEG